MSNFIDLLSGVYHFKEKFELASRSCHYRACPDNLDPRVTPEDDNRKRMYFNPEDDKDMLLSTSILSHLSNVILGFIPKIHTEHLTNVILGLVPRIHSEHLSNVILGLVPRIHSEHYSLLDTRDRLFVTPEYDNRRRMFFKPEDDNRKRMCLKPENAYNNLRPQCASMRRAF